MALLLGTNARFLTDLSSSLPIEYLPYAVSVGYVTLLVHTLILGIIRLWTSIGHQRDID